MFTERDLRQTQEKTLIIQLESGEKLSFPGKKWYKTIPDIAQAFGKSQTTVGIQLRKIIDDDPSIEVKTVNELRVLRRSTELDPGERPQTIICDQENLRKLILAFSSINKSGPPRKNSSEAKDKAGSHIAPPKPEYISIDGQESQRPSDFNDIPLDHKEPPYHFFKDKKTIRMPHEILALNSVSDALSHLADGTLQEITNDLKAFLEQVAIEHVQLPYFEDDPIEGILKTIFDSDSPKRLNRFFRITLDATLDLWDVIDTNEKRLKEEKEIIEICNILKKKGYDKEKVTKELFDHFPIPPTQEDQSQ